MKQSNKAGIKTATENVERRVSTKGNSPTRPEEGTLSPSESEEKLAWIRAIAREDRKLNFDFVVFRNEYAPFGLRKFADTLFDLSEKTGHPLKKPRYKGIYKMDVSIFSGS